MLGHEDRAELVDYLRRAGAGYSVIVSGERLHAWADKLEAEPETDAASADWEASCDQYREWWKSAERERDEAREELEQVRTLLGDARAALDGPMEGGTPPDWSVSDLAESVADSAKLTRRSRDEAREALRGLLDAVMAYAAWTDTRIGAAAEVADGILKGVERTHASGVHLSEEVVGLALDSLRSAYVYALLHVAPDEIASDFKPEKFEGYERQFAQESIAAYRLLLREAGDAVGVDTERVERTHALVLIPDLEAAAASIYADANRARSDSDRDALRALEHRLLAAARGKHPVQWPEGQR
jgi:hypothetical protein